MRPTTTTTVEKPGYVVGWAPGALEGAAAAGARCARAHHCHNDFITNPGARCGDYDTGSPPSALGGLRDGRGRAAEKAAAVFLSLYPFVFSRHLRSPSTLLLSCRRRRRRIFCARTHTHPYTLTHTNTIVGPQPPCVRVYTFTHIYTRMRAHAHTHTHTQAHNKIENAHYNNNII